MTSPFARIDLPDRPRDFQRIALDMGVPLLDKASSNSRLVRVWLGRFAAEPEWVDAQTLQFYLNDDQGRRIDPERLRPVSVSDLRGALRTELTALRDKLAQIQPRGKTEQTIASLLRELFDTLVRDPSHACSEGALFQYQDARRQPRLVWCWGYRRAVAALAETVLCRQPDCRRVYLWRSAAEAVCPKCGVAKPIYRFPWKKVLATAIGLMLLLSAGGWWYWHTLPRAVLNGQVIWSGFDLPVGSADVRIEALNRTVVTDQDGRFHLDRLPAGTWEVSVTAEGYRPWQASQTLERESEIHTPVELIGDGVLCGRVIDAGSRRPIAEAQVSWSETKPALKTDEDGRFRCEGFRRGPVAVLIKSEGYLPIPSDVKVTESDEQPVEIELSGDAVLIGRVLSAAQEQPLVGATVTLEQSGRTVRTDGEGWFVFKQAPAGRQVVIIESPGLATAQLDKELVAGQERQVQIRLAGAAKLSGTIVREIDSAPVGLAEVRVVGTKLVFKADEQGRFELFGASAGRATIEVAAAGYRSERLEHELSDKGETVLSFKLRGEAVLSGRVTDELTKQPVEQVDVRIVGTPYQTRTDAKGQYRMERVPSSPSKLDIRATGFDPRVVDVKPSSKAEHTLDVMLTGTVILSGVVIEKWTDKPLANVNVKVGSSETLHTTGNDGVFELKGLRGGVIHSLRFSVEGLPSRTELLMLSLRQTTQPKPLQIVLAGQGKQSGRVVSALDESAVGKAKVRLVGTDHHVETDETGEFQWDMLRVGRVVFEVSAPNFRPRRIEQVVSADSKPLTIVLGGDAAVTGEVLDAATKEPVANAQVQLEKTTLKTRTDAKGQYRLDGAFAGSGTLTITAEGYPDASSNLLLKSEQDVEADVALTGSGSLTGEVFGDDGRPVAEADVRVSGSEHHVATGPKGEFQLRQLRGGSLRIGITANQFASKSLMAELKVDEAKPLGRIMLVRSLTLKGQVVHALTEQPIANADITVGGLDQKARSDAQGRFQLDGLPAKRLLFKIVANGFVREQFWLNPTGDADIERFCLCPPPGENEVFVVLTWQGATKDLDAHLFRATATGTAPAHVFGERMQDDNLQSLRAAQNGHGPESLRISPIKPGRYEILVHAPFVDGDKAAHAQRLSQSVATLRVYRPGQTEPSQYVIGRNKSGTVWWPLALDVAAPGQIEERAYKSEHYRMSLPEMNVSK